MDMELIEWATVAVALPGVLVMLLSSIGLLRMPDFYTRMHMTGSAQTLGITLLLLCVGIYSRDLTTILKVLALSGLFLLTSPVVLHLVGHAAYARGINPGVATHHDDLKGIYTQEQNH